MCPSCGTAAAWHSYHLGPADDSPDLFDTLDPQFDELRRVAQQTPGWGPGDVLEIWPIYQKVRTKSVVARRSDQSPLVFWGRYRSFVKGEDGLQDSMLDDHDF